MRRAEKILKEMEEKKFLPQPIVKEKIVESSQSLFHQEIIDEIEKLDVTTLTPIEAMNFLYKISNRVKNS